MHIGTRLLQVNGERCKLENYLDSDLLGLQRKYCETSCKNEKQMKLKLCRVC